jgi:selenophosphate synthetase-related protein
LKSIDISKSVYEIVKNDPDVINIMKELGFKDITEPGMLNTAGRFMTIPKGAKMKKIPMNKIIEVFENYGYEINE